MIFISHRGNISCPNPERENTPSFIDEAIALGFDVEIDIQDISREYGVFLGHDDDEVSLVSHEWLEERKTRLWCHCKSIIIFESLLRDGYRCFMHHADDATLTSDNWIWTHPDVQFWTKRSIAVLPEQHSFPTSEEWHTAGGICSDLVLHFRDAWREISALH